MSDNRRRVSALEAKLPAPAPAVDELQPLRQLVALCLEHYPEAEPGCMARVDGRCTEWAVSWPFVWQFHDWLARHELATVPARFATEEEAQEAIEATYQALQLFRGRLAQLQAARGHQGHSAGN